MNSGRQPIPGARSRLEASSHRAAGHAPARPAKAGSRAQRRGVTLALVALLSPIAAAAVDSAAGSTPAAPAANAASGLAPISENLPSNQSAAPSAAAPAGAPPSSPAGPRVEVALEPTEVAVGDRVRATLTLRVPGVAPLDPLFPDWQHGWGKAEVLGVPSVARRAEGPDTVFVQELTLTAFEPGEVTLPPLTVELPGDGRATTPEGLRLTVRSVLPAGEQEAAPRPPAPPQALAWGPIFWWTLAGLAGLCLAAGAFVGARRAAIGGAGTVPAVPPLPELLAALGDLTAETHPERGFARLSLALRRYLGRRLGFHGLESSTTEIQRELAGRRLAPALVKRAVALLREEDQVKFARRPAEAPAFLSQLAAVREVAAAVEEHLAPPPPPPPPPAAEARP